MLMPPLVGLAVRPSVGGSVCRLGRINNRLELRNDDERTTNENNTRRALYYLSSNHTHTHRENDGRRRNWKTLDGFMIRIGGRSEGGGKRCSSSSSSSACCLLCPNSHTHTNFFSPPEQTDRRRKTESLLRICFLAGALFESYKFAGYWLSFFAVLLCSSSSNSREQELLRSKSSSCSCRFCANDSLQFGRSVVQCEERTNERN